MADVTQSLTEKPKPKTFDTVGELPAMPKLDASASKLSGASKAEFEKTLGIYQPFLTAQEGMVKGLGRAESDILQSEQEQKKLQATGTSAAAQKQVADIQGAQKALDEAMLKEPIPKFVPTKETADDLAVLFSIVNVMGFLIGGAGKENSQAAMSAMNGMLEGHQKGRADLYKRELSEFDKNFKAMVQKHAEFRRRYEDAVKLAAVDKEAGVAQAELVATEYGSEVVKAKAKKGDILGGLEVLNSGLNAVKEAQKRVEKLEDEASRRQYEHDKEMDRRKFELERQKAAFANAEKVAGIRAGAKATAADKFGFGDIVAGASNEAAAAIRNLMGLPFESTSGIFGGKQTNSLFTAPLDAFANTLTSESVQRYNTQSGKLGYNLAQLMSGGRSVRVSDVDQMNKILQIREGDTLETAASRIAEARQLAERTIEVRTKSPNTPEGLKEVFRENLQTIKETVPFTVDDINKFVANRDKSVTFAQALSKRYPSSESAPPSASSVVPGGVGKRGGTTGEASSVDVERSKAKAAIAGGKDPDAVKARFKEKTGQEL
jgi:hypothetical protein